MTILKVKLGAPSLTGKDCNDLVAEAFGEAKYPLAVQVQNHMPRDVVFPEVKGLFLRHVANKKESKAAVVIDSHDLFQRLASSVEQVAELNGYEHALTVSGEVAAEGKSEGKTEKTGDDSDDDGDAEDAQKPSDGLNADQIKELLKEKGIKFASNAKKDELAALLDAAPAAETDTNANDANADGAADAGAENA